MSKESNDIRKNLEEKFQQLIPSEDAPKELKQEVFDTLDKLNLEGENEDNPKTTDSKEDNTS